MSTTRLTYTDADALAQLVGDARAVEARMAFPAPRGHDVSGPDTALSSGAPGAPGTPAISDDLADRAAGMELHLT